MLLVEDERVVRGRTGGGPGAGGFRIRWPATGWRRSKSSRAAPTDLVLLDLMLPRMSGIDVCRAIRARSAVPIIMVTAKSTELDTVVGLEVGADDYVAKPYRLRELVVRGMRRASRVGGRGPGSAAIGRQSARRGDTGATARSAPRQPGLQPSPSCSAPAMSSWTSPATSARSRGRGEASPQGVRPARAAARERRAASSPGTRSSTGCGAWTTSATRRRSTCTSSGSGRGSRPTRPTRY